MTPTKSCGSIESIAFRAVIVISLFCAISGGAMIYIGSNNAEFWRKECLVERNKGNSPELKNCLKAAISTDRGDQVNLCYALYGPNFDVVRMQQDSVNKAVNMVSLGLALSVLPVPLFTFFFILRWIFTSRWQKAAPLENEEK